MEKIKCGLRRNIGSMLLALCALLFFCIELGAMYSSQEVVMSKDARKALHVMRDAQIKNRAEQLKKDEFFIYQDGTADGIVFPKSLVETSKVLKEMIADVGDDNQAAIPVHYYIGDIMDLFAVLKMLDVITDNESKRVKLTQIIKSSSLEQLVSLLNIVDGLDVRPIISTDPAKDFQTVLFAAFIKERIIPILTMLLAIGINARSDTDDLGTIFGLINTRTYVSDVTGDFSKNLELFLDDFLEKNKYDVLAGLAPAVQQRILQWLFNSHLLALSIYFWPSSRVVDMNGAFIEKLKSFTKISEVLNEFKVVARKNIEFKEYREHEIKMEQSFPGMI